MVIVYNRIGGMRTLTYGLVIIPQVLPCSNGSAGDFTQISVRTFKSGRGPGWTLYIKIVYISSNCLRIAVQCIVSPGVIAEVRYETGTYFQVPLL